MKHGSLFLLLFLLTLASGAQNNSSVRGMNVAKITGLVYDYALIPFYHGVASGDPAPMSVIIRTRVTPAITGIAAISGMYEVAVTVRYNDNIPP